MSSPYAPTSGSKAAAILEHMLGKPLGTKFTSAELGAAVAVESSSVASLAATAIRHGLLAAEPGVGRQVLYSLGAPRDPFDADEQRNGKPDQRIVKASAAPFVKPGPSSVFDNGGGTPPPSGFKGWLKRQAEDAQPPSPKPQKKPYRVRDAKTGAITIIRAHVAPPAPSKQAAPDLSCAMFNTGDLVIEAPGQPSLRLNARQCADLVGYLQRFHSAVV